MKIIITRRGKEQRIIDVADATMYEAETKCVIATFEGAKWSVKESRAEYQVSLKKLQEYSGNAFFLVRKNTLVRKGYIVGKILDFGCKGGIGLVMADGQKIEVARRRRPEFNRLLNGMIGYAWR